SLLAAAQHGTVHAQRESLVFAACFRRRGRADAELFCFHCQTFPARDRRAEKDSLQKGEVAMAAIQASLGAMVDWFLRSSWQAGLLALVVLLATSLPRRWLSASARYGLLLLVAARLLMPIAPR